jgi:hypothetical protein
MRKIKIPGVGRYIRAFGQIADVAQIALIDNFPVILLVDTVDFAGTAFINQIEQGGKRLTQAYAAAAAVTDVEYPLHFFEGRLFVVKVGVEPVERMPDGSFQRTFANGHVSLA